MNIDQLVNEFSEKLSCGNGMIFIGAGISVPSGLPDWSSLLSPFARSIDPLLEVNGDLPQIAQYIVNSNGDNRGPLVQAIKEKLTGNFPLNKYHKHLQRTNVETIWTTNYDTMIENTFNNFIKEVKTHDDAISRSISAQQIEIIKMHGCIATSPFKDIVLTIKDYENFFINRPATSERLRTDLLKNSFLFIGYGYGDPNIENIIVEARRLSNQATRQHYMIMASEEEPQKKIRQQLWIRDLRRIGIACVLISDYSELDFALKNISLKSRGKTIYITGGHEIAGEHEDYIERYQQYGEAFSNIENLTILDGQSEGVSRKIISSFTEACLKKRQDIRCRIKLFINPYAIKNEFNNDPSLIPELKKWRAPLLRKAQIVVVFDGKIGTRAEIDVAKEMGCLIMPVIQKENDFPSTLLQEKDIREQLQESVPGYIEKAETYSMTPTYLKTCIEKVLTI